MIIGCYTLDLYCDNKDCYTVGMPHQFTGPSAMHCYKQARAIGWIINLQKSKAYCPRCKEKQND